MRGFLALTGGALATIALLADCSSSGPAGGGDAGCVDPPPAYACNMGASAQAHAVDEDAGCVGPEVTFANLCVSSVSCFRAASIASVCLVSPDGALYFATVTNDQDITGPGWHEVHDRNYGAPLPADNQPTAQDRARCTAAELYPCCAGVSPPPLLCAVHDAGVRDAVADDG